MGATRFEEVELWKKAHAWVLAIYRFSALFPKHELFGLTSQLRRAAVSVPANFAEGFKRLGRADKVRFFNISQGSREEYRYYLILSRDLGYGKTEVLIAAVDEVARMLASYIETILSRR